MISRKGSVASFNGAVGALSPSAEDLGGGAPKKTFRL